MTTTSANPLQPETYRRRILLAVCGTSPQIVTETLYWLAVQRQPAWIPSEIRVITTSKGRETVERNLLHPDRAWFERLCHQYQLPPIEFNSAHIDVVPGSSGQELADLTSPDDNLRAADFIMNRVRGYTTDENAALHVSIAGGRKTMGFYLGYMMGLLGRPQDVLSHVLVSEPFENHPEFYFPTRDSHIIDIRDKGPHDTSLAKVMLAEIPLVRLRGVVPAHLVDQARGYEDLIRVTHSALNPELQIDLENGLVRTGSEILRDLPPSSLALLTMFARAAKLGNPGIDVSETPSVALAKNYLSELKTITRQNGHYDKRRESLGKNSTAGQSAVEMNSKQFGPMRSALNKALRERLSVGAQPYLIEKVNRKMENIEHGKSVSRYCLTLRPDQIHFCPIDK